MGTAESLSGGSRNYCSISSKWSLLKYITLRWCVPMVEGVCGNSRKPVRREQKLL